MRRATVVIAVLLGVAVLAPVADAKISILDEEGTTVDTIGKGTCRISGKKENKGFLLVAKSVDGKFSLAAYIDAPVFDGVDRSYPIYYGGKDPQVFLRRRADGEVFGNYKISGTPPGVVGGGAIDFRKKGTRVGIGLAPAPNASFTEQYSFAGGLSCRYTKR